MSHYIHQGELSFSSDYKIQRTYGLHESAVFFLEGIGATLFSCFLLLNDILGMMCGFVITVLAIVLLFAHLGHPENAWRSLTSIRTSWISRGILFVAVFGISGLLYFGTLFSGQYSAGNPLSIGLKAVLLLMALMILVYPGLVLASSPSVPFWNNGLLPVSFVITGATSGLAWFMLYLSISGRTLGTFGAFTMVWIQIVLLVLLAICIVSHILVMKNSTGAGRESVNYLLRGRTLLLFSLVAGIIGMLLPLVLAAIMVNKAEFVGSLLLVSAIARTFGDLCLRYTLIKVGMYDPVY